MTCMLCYHVMKVTGTLTVKLYILTLFEMKFWNCRENFEKRLSVRATAPPQPLQFLLQIWTFYLISFFEMKCRPGPTGPIGATPVPVFVCAFSIFFMHSW